MPSQLNVFMLYTDLIGLLIKVERRSWYFRIWLICERRISNICFMAYNLTTIDTTPFMLDMIKTTKRDQHIRRDPYDKLKTEKSRNFCFNCDDVYGVFFINHRGELVVSQALLFYAPLYSALYQFRAFAPLTKAAAIRLVF